MEDTNKKQSKAIIFGIIVASVGLIMLISSALLYLYLKNQDNQKSKNESDVNVEVSPTINNSVEPTDTIEVNKFLTYTNSNYPSFSFDYPTSWNLNEEITMDIAPNTKLILEKETSKLIFDLQSYPVFGYGPPKCYRNDELSISKVGDWYKGEILTEKKKFYSRSFILDKNDFKDYIVYHDSNDTDINNYVACGEIVSYESIKTIFTTEDYKEIFALIAIDFEDIESNQRTNNEMDEIVKSIKY